MHVCTLMGFGTTTDAEYVALRREAVARVPKDIDPVEFAPILCAGVTTFNGIRQMGITPGELVAVQGLGGLGHLAIQFAAKMGFRVVALSSSAGKEAFAKDFGASDYINYSSEDAVAKLNSMGGAALIVATAPNPKVIAPLVDALQPGGKLLILARKFPRIPCKHLLSALTRSA
jgi:D-arabinose 1-dehydrogenase-like Zn-dependent alcohol dehydrogenase